MASTTEGVDGPNRSQRWDPRPTSVDVLAGQADELLGLANEHLCLIGLHHALGVGGRDEVVDAMIAPMALLQATHGSSSPASASARPTIRPTWRAQIDEALEDACARFRFPRPAHLVMMY